MNSNYSASNPMPEAYVAINKSRLKSYNNNSEPTYYLSDKTEFQLELFNPTQETILAKIKLDNKSITQGGLVLKPGERIFLERYLDVAKKFLFETYEVEAENNEVKQAIKNNGNLLVEFFKETNFYINDYSKVSKLPWNNGGFYSNTNQTYYNLMNHNHNLTNPVTCTLDSLSTISSSSNSWDVNTNLVKTTKYNQNLSKLSSVRSVKSMETGKIEMGSNSDQKMKTVDKEFTPFSFHSISAKILPISLKLNDIGSVVKPAKYCSSCGYKVNYNDKYCSSCGHKL